MRVGRYFRDFSTDFSLWCPAGGLHWPDVNDPVRLNDSSCLGALHGARLERARRIGARCGGRTACRQKEGRSAHLRWTRVGRDLQKRHR